MGTTTPELQCEGPRPGRSTGVGGNSSRWAAALGEGQELGSCEAWAGLEGKDRGCRHEQRSGEV